MHSVGITIRMALVPAPCAIYDLLRPENRGFNPSLRSVTRRNQPSRITCARTDLGGD